jgi:hypothetical protein
MDFVYILEFTVSSNNSNLNVVRRDLTFISASQETISTQEAMQLAA